MVIQIIISLFLIAALIIIIYTIVQYTKKHKSKMSFKESLDLTNLPVVTFMNGDKKINFLLDTGSDASYINHSVLSNYNYTKSDYKTTFVGSSGEEVNSNSCYMNITYNDYLFAIELSIANLDDVLNMIKARDGVNIHGILGSIFLQEHKYVLDFNSSIAYRK